MGRCVNWFCAATGALCSGLAPGRAWISTCRCLFKAFIYISCHTQLAVENVFGIIFCLFFCQSSSFLYCTCRGLAVGFSCSHNACFFSGDTFPHELISFSFYNLRCTDPNSRVDVKVERLQGVLNARPLYCSASLGVLYEMRALVLLFWPERWFDSS